MSKKLIHQLQFVTRNLLHNFETACYKAVNFILLNRDPIKDYFYVSFRGPNTKCFSMDINYNRYKMIKRIQILIRNDDLIQNIETNDGKSEIGDLQKPGRFQLFMHYPRQLLRTAAIHDEAIVGSNSSLTGTKFTLKQMEV